uniref:Uncharacterized protein n=1 Tax=Haptolina brevifila TaxID=156173 RepID=A0A7S2G9G5_9EUKA|mmetsp:Transcript_30178/g.60564  ORF Transcript_30178/g.60564 Transcript_30178/m.60564 type:complete len:169 (+) Transcript_30178:24-530(+)|eukprot:CAMPEP_0174718648 /NCGR_PEP_ID=MMETSP1094-20130205/29582_1 /TAXON_ID=156173 /ORGANISM="Chrysochromulina brevifilum, Strain UTEX LB 985" /LENGTH=168 /DNA_ID=CAMNT_0015918801 /DNA_START=24 /DNA_END=530 /DNA_ORIENTATION=+
MKRSSLACLVCVMTLAIAADDVDEAARRKAVRMKSTRQLKEILTELKIEHKGLGKDDLKELAFTENAVERWEDIHPEKKKRRRSPEDEEREQIIQRLSGMGLFGSGQSGQLASMDLEALRNLDKQLGGLGNLFGGGLKFGAAQEKKSDDDGAAGGESQEDETADHEEL